MTSRDSILGVPYAPGGPVPGGSVESHWVNLRWRRIPAWIMLMAASIAGSVAIPIQMVRQIGEPYIGGSEITGGVVFLVLSVGVAVWMAWIAPRAFTRQGVAVDYFGVALIQDPNLWFAGRTVRIPWDLIQSATEEVTIRHRGDSHSKHKAVVLSLNLAYQQITTPSWAIALPEYVAGPGSAPTQLTRIRIKPGNRWQSKVAGAIRAVRPDLVR